jgi:YjbE family integral membrane protein
MEMMTGTFWLQVLQIIWINILLSGDNAVVIALACRSLAPEQRKWGVILGAAAAVVLRIIFTIFVAQLMQYPYLKLIGGALLLWIAVKLLIDETDESDIKESHTIWSAVQTVVIADIIMSLDNVVAIAAAAKGSNSLIIFGLVISVPLIIFGATLIITLLQRFPILVWAGAALLGWVAGELIASDPFWDKYFSLPSAFEHFIAPAIGAAFVVGLAWFLKQRESKHEAA